MFNTKLLFSFLLALAVVLAQVGNVAAAPQTQDTTPISGTVQSVVTEPDANGETIVVVTILDDQGATQTVRLSVETALTLELVTLDPTTQEPVANETQYGELVEIDPEAVIPDEEPAEDDVHPISWLLATFFTQGDPSMTNEMAVAIDSFHNGDHEDLGQVFGFGVIAQALWTSQDLNDGTADVELAAQILEAKQTGDYSQIELPEGFTWPDDVAPSNWGQFKKAVKAWNESEDKHNLGTIVSDQPEDEDTSIQQNQGNGPDKNEDKDKKNKKNKNKNKNK